MTLTPTRRKLFLCFWAASICWMYVGLLVNFHQHRIWGKELIPQFYFYKRGVDKPFKSWDLSKKSIDRSGDSFDHFDFTFLPASSLYLDQPLIVTDRLIKPAVPPITCKEQSPCGLRAPPLA